MSYNLTAITANTTGLLGFVQGVNVVLMKGWLGTLLLMGITVVVLIAFIRSTGDTNRAVAGTAFVAFILSILLKAVSLIPTLALFITLVLSGAAIAFTWKST